MKNTELICMSINTLNKTNLTTVILVNSTLIHWIHVHTNKEVGVNPTFPAAAAPCSTEKLQGRKWKGQINQIN